ncbi:SIMPL domain-containing protein [Halorussus caseinilyticus]|uniref:SIMPL domain-containing protein n=1 Tax=Halorussus caseinilyticus TaxID=3034025 RepID=A0ABD5WUU0_9EURY|nr:SIMPL domain-containing protein [Halorussus sp. DT72]
MHRGILATVGVAVLLATAGCVGSLAPTDGASARTQQLDRESGTIGVSATGQVEAEPDQAIVQVAVLARGDDANAVRERIAENATQMREALRRAGIGDDQIRTVAFRIDQEYREVEGERRPAGFEGVHAFEITLSNVSRAGAILDTAVANGADRVDSVELTLSDERRRAVRSEALRDAMENARADADVIAESANLTISGVHTATTGDLNFSPVRAEALSADAGGGGGTSIESGPVTVTAQVQVTYNASG